MAMCASYDFRRAYYAKDAQISAFHKTNLCIAIALNMKAFIKAVSLVEILHLQIITNSNRF